MHVAIWDLNSSMLSEREASLQSKVIHMLVNLLFKLSSITSELPSKVALLHHYTTSLVFCSFILF
jgi:hypothetical protein